MSREARARFSTPEIDGSLRVAVVCRQSGVARSRRGFIAKFVQGLRAGADVEVRLLRAGVVTGHVVNERGEPVWGSTVQFCGVKVVLLPDIAIGRPLALSSTRQVFQTIFRQGFVS